MSVEQRAGSAESDRHNGRLATLRERGHLVLASATRMWAQTTGTYWRAIGWIYRPVCHVLGLIEAAEDRFAPQSGPRQGRLHSVANWLIRQLLKLAYWGFYWATVGPQRANQ